MALRVVTKHEVNLTDLEWALQSKESSLGCRWVEDLHELYSLDAGNTFEYFRENAKRPNELKAWMLLDAEGYSHLESILIYVD